MHVVPPVGMEQGAAGRSSPREVGLLRHAARCLVLHGVPGLKEVKSDVVERPPGDGARRRRGHPAAASNGCPAGSDSRCHEVLQPSTQAIASLASSTWRFHCWTDCLGDGRQAEPVFDPRRGYPSAVVYLRYADPIKALHWLTEVVQAREAVRMTLPGGRIGHAELTIGNTVASLGHAADPA